MPAVLVHIYPLDGLARDAFWSLLACSKAILLAKSYPIQLGPDLMQGEELLNKGWVGVAEDAMLCRGGEG